MKSRSLKTLTALVLSAVLFTSAPVLAAENTGSNETTTILDAGAEANSLADSAKPSGEENAPQEESNTLSEDGAASETSELPADDPSAQETPADGPAADPEETPAADPASPAEGENTDPSDTPSGETPSEETPSEETPSEEVPSGEAPSEETPSEETPAADVTPAPEAEEAPAEATDGEETTPEAEEATEETPAEETPTEEAPALTALDFQDEALIALWNARMNVSDAALLARYSEVPGSLSAVTASLPGQTGADVDAMLRTYYAYTALDLAGAGSAFIYPEGSLDRWNAMKDSMTAAGLPILAVLPSVDIMAVHTEGNLITVETEEVYFVRVSGADQQVLSYIYHNVFSFSAENETTVLTGIENYDSVYSQGEEDIELDVQASYTGGKYGVAESAMVEKAIQWGIGIAKDQTHGYSQAVRWGPDYDCSSFVISCFGYAGFNLGYMNWPNDTNHEDDLYYTGNIKQPFIDAGFTWISAEELGGMDKPTNLKRGDIVLREYHHTEIYIGNGYLLGSHGQEPSAEHPLRSSATGDQADELSVIKYTNYYGKGYDGVLRLIDEPDYVKGSYTVTSDVNIRTGPATCYEAVSIMPAGSLLRIEEVRGKWGRYDREHWISLHCAKYNMKAIPFSKITVSGASSTYDFINKAIKPTLKVRYSGVTLTKGTNYTVKYSSNKRPGTATITLTGDGVTITGTRTINFEIVPRAGTYLTTAAINLRKTTDTSSQKLLQMPEGSYVYASNIKKVGTRYWAQTTFKGKTGWFFFGYGNYLTSKDIATNLVTDGSFDPSKTYMIVSADNPLYAYGTVSIKPNTYARFYKVNRDSEKQRFHFVPGTSGAYMIESAYSEQVVAPRSGKTGSGVNLNLQTPAATAIQSWNVRNNGDGTFSFLNAATGRAFRCAGGKVAYKGASETYKDTTSSAAQKFYLIEVPDVDNSYDGLYFIRKASATNYVFMVKSKSLKEGASLVLYKKTNAASKKFRMIYSGGGYYRLVAPNTGFAVTLKDNSNDILTPLVMSTWKGTNSQLWKPVKNSDGTICFVNKNGYAISLTGNNIANKTVIRVDAYEQKDAEKWKLSKAS